VWGRWHVFGKREMYIGVWLGNLEQEDDFQIRHAWEVNVKVELKEIGWRSMVCFHLIQGRDM